MSLDVGFRQYARAQAWRVLTHMDRDPDSPTFGCFDRDYWHYKIRDFPSSILQQAVFLLEAVRRRDLDIGLDRKTAVEWEIAAINALSRQVYPSGAMDEYFPFESSYPAAAFALYAACRILKDWSEACPELLARVSWVGLRRLARHVSRRQEGQASNQYAAAIAGLALAATLPQMKVQAKSAFDHVEELLKLQHSEGWFNEYGGPDFGYLTVTLDALVDYQEVSGDHTRISQAIDKAIAFIAEMLGADGELPWTLNARNTDYVVPYGLVRAASRNRTAAWVVQTLFTQLYKVSHTTRATDDRYHLHYIFSSIVRSIRYAPEMLPPAPLQPKPRQWMPGCGFWVVHDQFKGVTIFVAARKGGLIRIHFGDGRAAKADHGWRLYKGRHLWTTNWWSERWQVEHQKAELEVDGRAQACRFRVSSPLKHIALRGAAFILRSKLTPILKQLLIFGKRAANGPPYHRQVALKPGCIVVTDTFSPTKGISATRAPRHNLRHVASADSFHPEDGQGSALGPAELDLEKKQSLTVELRF